MGEHRRNPRAIAAQRGQLKQRPRVERYPIAEPKPLKLVQAAEGRGRARERDALRDRQARIRETVAKVRARQQEQLERAQRRTRRAGRWWVRKPEPVVEAKAS